VLLAATLAMFGDVLVAGSSRLLSRAGEDLSIFYYWHRFGFGELARGNLALWNPHVFGGAPYLGGFQPALLYPPNWLHLVLPTAVALNVGIALHVFLAGFWVFLWTAHRRLQPVACLLAALAFMFCGAHFLQIYRGHLANLYTLVWAPLILLAIDGTLETPRLRWTLVGAAAVALQILAGHVQYVYYTAIVAALYALLGWLRSARRPRTLAALAGIYAGGACLAAVQLLPGIQAVSESLRAALSYEIARTFAFPPENLLTLALPGVFGDMEHTPYWGRWTLSETSVFVGTATLLLAICGAVLGSRKRTRGALAMAAVAFVLACGYYTPLYGVLYEVVPGIASFRGITKFTFLATLFLLMLAAVGLDRLLRAPALPRWPARAAFGLAGACVAVGLAVLVSSGAGSSGWWGRLVGGLDVTDEAFRYFPVDRSGTFPQRAGGGTAWSLFIGGASFALSGGLYVLARSSRRWLYALALFGVVEVFVHARAMRPTFDPLPLEVRANALRDYLGTIEPGFRMMSFDRYLGLAAGARDIWGDDPMVLRRYAELVAATQGTEPARLMVSAGPSELSPRLGVLRLKYVLRPAGAEAELMTLTLDALPRGLLVHGHRVIDAGAPTVAAVLDPAFDPRATVLLEAEPDPRPVASEQPGSVSVVDVSSDAMVVRAEVPAPALLLMTENYSSGWRATAVEGGQVYTVMPADHALLAIPLAAGSHHLRLEYRPLAFTIGLWVTIASLVAGVALLWVDRQSVRT
jgi:hypothetical protein